MITSRDVHKEVKIAEEAVKNLPPVGKVVVKLLTVIIKIILSIRGNTKLIMDKLEVKFIESKRTNFQEIKKETTTAKLDNPVIKIEDKVTTVDKKE